MPPSLGKRKKRKTKEDDLGKTQIYEWSSHFLNGEMTINYKLGPERPLLLRTDKVFAKLRALVLEDRHWTMDEQEMSGIK